MSNMSLEKALDQLKIKVENEPNDINAWKTIVEILEIKLSNVQKENQELKARCKAIPPLVIQNEKLLKAIEILKENYPLQFKESANVGSPNVINYSVIVGGTLRVVEKEEYDLLKEVLGNE